jgi:hypothetical protein
MTTKLPTTRQVWLLSLGFALVGTLCLASSFGLLQDWGINPRRRTMTPAPPWVISCAGCTFLFGGLAALLTHYHYRIAARIAGLIATAGIGITFLWLLLAGQNLYPPHQEHDLLVPWTER